MAPLFRFPSEATKCFAGFTRNKNLFAGCVIPPKRRKIRAEVLYKTHREGAAYPYQESGGVHEVVVRQPEIMLLGKQSAYDDTIDTKIFAINKNGKDIKVCPYRIGNVDNDGNICWPDDDYPKDLRQAHQVFWASGFSSEPNTSGNVAEGDEYIPFLKKPFVGKGWMSLTEVLHKSSTIEVKPKGADALVFDEEEFFWVKVF